MKDLAGSGLYGTMLQTCCTLGLVYFKDPIKSNKQKIPNLERWVRTQRLDLGLQTFVKYISGSVGVCVVSKQENNPHYLCNKQEIQVQQ